MTTYEELGMVQSNESVIPADCLSFAEQAMFIAEYAQEEYNNLFEAVGVEELAVYESTGAEIIYEGAKLDAFKTRAINFFKKIWAAIKGAFEKVYAFFIQKSKKAMEEIGKIDSATVDKALKANPEKEYGTTHNFSDAKEAFKDRMNKCVSLAEKINKAFDSCDSKFFKAISAYGDENKKMKEVDKIKEDLLVDIFETAGKKGSETLSDVKTAIRDELKEVKANGTFIKANLADMIKVVKDGKTVDDLKESYTTIKKIIDKAIDKAKGLKEENMRSAAQRVMVLGKLANAADTVANTYFDIFKRRFTEYLLILARVSKDAKKADKKAESEKEEKKEAANASYVFNTDTVDVAFDW